MKDCLEKINKKGNLICIGLDPDLKKMPMEYNDLSNEVAVLSFLEEIIRITSNFAAAYKIQKAFVDLYGGPKLLKDLIEVSHKIAPDKPVIVDCKVGDTRNTMDAYLENIFENANADAIVINPFMGRDIFESLEKYPDKGVLVIVRSSNHGADIIQDIDVLPPNGKKQKLWEYLLDQILMNFNSNGNIIPILSDQADLNGIRGKLPQNMLVFYAGVGAQGGDIRKIKHLLNDSGGGVIIGSSRSILYPYSPEDKDWRAKVSEAIKTLHLEALKLREYRDER